MLSHPKHKITATEKVTDPSNASVLALASHQAAASAAAAQWPATAKLPSVPSSESIDESAVKGESSGTPQIGDTADPTGTENTPGGEVAKDLPGSHTSSRVNKWKTVDIVDLTDSDFDEGGKTSDSIGSSKTQHKRKQGHTTKWHKSATDPIDVDAENVLTDINIVDISATSMKMNHKNTNCDLDEFFEDMAEVAGKDGRVRKCHACKIFRLTLVSDTTTQRRHIESLENHKAKYNTWACTNNFESKLPKELKAKVNQGTLDNHLKEMPKKEQVVPFTNATFCDAAIEWLIITDQAIQALANPSFKKMIDIGPHATKGVLLPMRKGTRDDIMTRFKTELMNLKERLNLSLRWPQSLDKLYLIHIPLQGGKVKGLTSLTCNAWQASKADAYFPVTSHWIQELTPGSWEVQSALFGFTKLNNAHNGKWLGGALFRIIDRLIIIHKALIETHLKAPHYNPAHPDEHMPDTDDVVRDEVGLIQAIAERSSAKRKDLFMKIQACKEGVTPLQLILNMPVRWSSTYMMCDRGEKRRQMAVCQSFVMEMSWEESDLTKYAKIHALKLSESEWDCLKACIDLLGHADKAQQAFSSDAGPSLHLALPALEALHRAWTTGLGKEKYWPFTVAI
ncbi:hypothetical protein JB92DRAFT_3131662 [Gautieria morchelliformis]|nr:hypothetical protein JB92DRAFT_3131662 [Gautieria morchelliformis]